MDGKPSRKKVKLGKTFTAQNLSACPRFAWFRYSFIPASAVESAKSRMKITGNKVNIQYSPSSHSKVNRSRSGNKSLSKSNILLQGNVQKTSETDCVLIYDQHDDTYILEKVGIEFNNLRHVRQKPTMLLNRSMEQVNRRQLQSCSSLKEDVIQSETGKDGRKLQKKQGLGAIKTNGKDKFQDMNSNDHDDATMENDVHSIDVEEVFSESSTSTNSIENNDVLKLKLSSSDDDNGNNNYGNDQEMQPADDSDSSSMF